MNNPFLSLVPDFNNLANKVEWQESRGKQNAISPKGAFGVMQLEPDTARDPGFGVRPLDPNAADQEEENRRMGRDYLKAMLDRYGGDEQAALVAYNWGPGNADKWVAGGKDFSRLPRETQGYIRNILGGNQVAEPMMLGPSEDAPALQGQAVPLQAKMENPFLKLVPKKQEIPQGVAREVPASEMPEVTAQEPPLSWGDWGEDVMNSLTSGTIGMATGLAGLPGEIERFGESFIPEDQRGADLPNVEAVDKWVRGKIGDYDYDPKSVTGGAVKSVLPYTLAAGKLGAAKGWLPNARNAANVAKVYAGGKVGQAVGGNVGEIIGAAAMGGRTGMPKTPSGGFKDTAAAFREGTKQYGLPEKLGVNVGGRQLYGFTQSLKLDKNIQDILKQPNLEGSLPNAVSGLLNAVPRPRPTRIGNVTTLNFEDMSVKDFDKWRRSISKFLGRDDPNVRRQAKIVLDKMDEFFRKDGNLTGAPKDIAKARASLPKAREAWRRGMQSKRLDSFNRLAENRAVGLTGSGRDNAIRLEYKKLIDKIDRSDVEKNKWSKDEIAAIRKIARIGWGPRRLLRTAGRFNPMGLGGFGYAGYGGLTGDWESAGLVGGLTLGSRALAGSLAARRAAELQRLALAGGKKVSDPNQILRGAMGGYLGTQ